MPKLLTINELAEYYSVSRQTIWRWVGKGMPYLTIPSGAKRFDIMEVVEWCDRNKEEGE